MHLHYGNTGWKRDGLGPPVWSHRAEVDENLFLCQGVTGHRVVT